MSERNITEDLQRVLDEDISYEELTECINRSKRGKAVAEDLISNEFLKTSTSAMLRAVLHLFNQCLSLGAYPWGTSIVTPLHKKGDTYNPNNYRAIAVASNLGNYFQAFCSKGVFCSDLWPVQIHITSWASVNMPRHQITF